MAAQAFVHNAVGATGVAEAGARLRGFVQGTTTPQTLYVNSGLSVAATFPYVADAAGHILVYYDDALDWTFQVKTANDASTLLEVDVVGGVVSITYADLGNFNSFQDAISDLVSVLGSADQTLAALAALGLEDRKLIRGTGVDTAENVTGSQVLNVYNVLDYGAVPNCIKGTTGVATSGDATFTDAGASFTDADIGKTITIAGAGVAGAALSTTIASRNSATSIELTVAPSTTVASNCVYLYGTPAQEAIEDAINAALAAGGGTVVIAGDTRGNAFLCTDSVYPDLLDADLIIEFRGGTVLNAGAGLGDPVLQLWAASSDQSTWLDYDLAILNPRIDCSLGDSPLTGGQFCTGISVQYLRNVLIDNPWLYGGTSPTNTNADTGIDTVSCKKVLVRGGLIEGFNDGGIYPNGDNTAGVGNDDGLECILDNVTIRRCNSAVIPKRELRLLKVIGGLVDECAAGIVSTDVTSPYVGPCRQMEILGTHFRKFTANGVRFTAGTKGSVRDCTFQDWGYDPVTGTGSVGTNAYAVDFFGASDIDFSNNTYKLVDWVADEQRAYRFRNGTFNSVPFTHGNCRFVGEKYESIWRTFGIEDAGDPHFFDRVHFDGLTDAIWPTTNLNADTFGFYTQTGASQTYMMRGGVVHPVGPQGVWFVLASSGAAIAHTGTTDATTLATVTIPAGLMRANGIVRINSTWVAGANNANAKSCLVLFGGTGGTQYQNVNIASTVNLSKEVLISNRNNAASQVGSFVATSGNSLSTSTGSIPTSSVNTASSVDVVFRCVLGNAGDTVTLERYSVEVCSVA